MATRPVFENRPTTDLAGLQSAVRRYIQGLERFLDDEMGPDVGPGAGIYGGDGEIVESVTLDDEGRVTDVTTTPRGTVEGSVFSMVGPAGATAPVVAYDFTQFDPALTAAQNLTAANVSGDSAYDLSIGGSAAINFVAKGGDPQGSPHVLFPFAARADGGALFSGSGSDYANTTGSPSGIQFLGAMTAEWLGYITVAPGGTSDVRIFQFADGSGAEAENDLYRLMWRNSDATWIYAHESGAGSTLCTAALVPSAIGRFAEMRLIPQHLVITRDGSGNINFFINGHKACAEAAPSPTALPTGGTAANLRIAIGSDPAVRIATLGFRLFGIELTAAQVRASYQRTLFGVSA